MCGEENLRQIAREKQEAATTNLQKCQKCGKVTDILFDCWFCGPVCGPCAFECFELNQHTKKESSP